MANVHNGSSIISLQHNSIRIFWQSASGLHFYIVHLTCDRGKARAYINKGAMDVEPIGQHSSGPNRDQIIVVNLFARGSSILMVRFCCSILVVSAAARLSSFGFTGL